MGPRTQDLCRWPDGVVLWSHTVRTIVRNFPKNSLIHFRDDLVILGEDDVFVVSNVAVDRTLRGWVTRWWKAAWELTVMLLILLFRNLTKLRWAARLAQVCFYRFYFGLGWMMSSCMIKDNHRQSSPIIANHRQSSGPSMGLMPRYSLSKASCYLACLTVMWSLNTSTMWKMERCMKTPVSQRQNPAMPCNASACSWHCPDIVWPV